MRLTVVRHGETNHNAKGILMGQGSDVSLNLKGRIQVSALAKRLKKDKIDIIYCSDLTRTKETVKEIIKYQKTAPVIYTKDLRERDVGTFSGRPREELYEKFKEYNGNPVNFRPKGGESVMQVKDRVRNFLLYLKRNHRNEHVLLVSHGGVMRVIYSILNRKSLLKSFQSLKFGNTALCEYHITGSKVKIVCFNDVAHLK